MHCEACGNENRPGSRFCDRCGAALSLSCPACGTPNRGDAQFCSECGGAMGRAGQADAPASPATERRQVSVLFADIVGFTSFAEGRDPERVRELQSRYFELASETVERHGGTVEKFIGDAVMAVWGTPTAHEDDAQRAARTGLQLLEAVEALGHGLQARAGVVTGEAAVTIGATNQGMVAGDMVNTASRLQSSAEGGEVLVDANTVQAASTAIGFEPAEARALKGKAEPVHAWRAVRVLATRAGENVVEPPFVGRAEELRRMKELLNAAGRDRRIRLVSITGPAGIGKSRLIEELGLYADGLAEDVWWHTGRSPSYGEGLAFWALGEMVRRRAGLVEDDDPKVTRERVQASVDEFVADPDEREWIAGSLLTLLGVTAGADGESLFPAWRTFFERIAERGTTVLVFEDLQWADTGTLDFIEHLLDWSRTQPIVVVTLARPELLDVRPGWGTARSNASAMALEPLDAASMREMLDGMVPGLPEAQADAIVQRAEGMPLYAVEIVRALVADGRLRRAGDVYEPAGDLGDIAIPASLRSLIASRLDGLDPEERSLLQHGSVLGQAFSTEALASVTGRDGPELEPRLRALVRREMLEIEADPRSPERGQYRFVQSLIREVAYDTLALRERRTRHLAAARYLEASEADEVAGALASHYLAAYRASEEGPEADAVAAQARVSLRAAAERAAELGAHEQAVRNLEHALTITTDPGERALLLERAATSGAAARLSGASDLARAAVEARRSLGDEDATLKAIALLADVLIDDGDVEEAADLLNAQVGERSSADAQGEGDAMLYAMLARAEMRRDRNVEGVAAADRAIEIGERLELPYVIAAAFINKGSAYAGLGRAMEAGALLRAGAELAEEGGWLHLALRGRTNWANVIGPNDPAAAAAIWDRTIDLARRVGDRAAFLWSAFLKADFAFASGDPNRWAEAETLLDEAEPLADGMDRVAMLVTRTYLAAVRGEDPGELIQALDASLGQTNDPRASQFALQTRLWTNFVAGRADEVIAHARRGIELDPWFVFTGTGTVANSVIRLGDRATADLYHTTSVEQPEHTMWTIACRRHLEGAVAALDGRPDEALELIGDSMERFSRIGMGIEAGMGALSAAQIAPNDPRVRPWLDRARATFASVDARPLVEMVDAALSSSATAAGDRLAAAQPDEASALSG